MLWDSSQEIMSSPNPNSGITWEGYSRPRALKVKFFQLTKSSKKDQTILKPSESSWNINPEPEFITCINNTETPTWTAPWVNCTKKWLVTTELHQTQFQLSELWYWTEKTKSEDPDPTCSERTDLSSLFSEPLIEPVKTDTKPSLKPTDPTPSSNDVVDI